MTPPGRWKNGNGNVAGGVAVGLRRCILFMDDGMNGLLGKKIGMTSIFDDAGHVVPCTVIEAGPCFVTQIKTKDRDGYQAVQLGFEMKRERLVKKPAKGHFAKASVKPLRIIREFRDEAVEVQPGQEFKVDSVFNKGDVVSVIGTSKGKGFQGVVRRHHFGGVREPMARAIASGRPARSGPRPLPPASSKECGWRDAWGANRSPCGT